MEKKMDTSTSNIDVNLLEPAAVQAMQKYIEAMANTGSLGVGKEPPTPIGLQYSLAISAKRIADVLESMHIRMIEREANTPNSEQTSPTI
jgi:hypothetical protein